MDADTLRRFADARGDLHVDVNVIYPTETDKNLAAILSKIPHRPIMPESGSIYRVAERYFITALSFEEFQRDPLGAIAQLLPQADRINIMLYDYAGFNPEAYRTALLALKEHVLPLWLAGHKLRLNILTDPASLRRPADCTAGSQSVTLAPNGRYYLCPAFYYNDPDDHIGTVDTGWHIPAPELLRRDHAPVCRPCRLNACTRCLFDNRQTTAELNTPSYEQCRKAETEMAVSHDFFKELRQCASQSDK